MEAIICLPLHTSLGATPMKSSGSKITCVVPSRSGVVSAWRTWPRLVSDSRSLATAGLATSAIARSPSGG
jgi:hypothetical protein